VQVIAHLGGILQLDGKQPGQLFLPDVDPPPPVRVVLASQRILATEPSATHTPRGTMKYRFARAA
jgi:hypothetical protein